MSNRWTRVPEAPVPALPAVVRLLIRPADLFLLIMISRPATGSLRTTWVTPATLQLGFVVGAVSLVLACVSLYRNIGGFDPFALAGGLLLLILGVGAGSVAIVGVAQRRALKQASGS